MGILRRLWMAFVVGRAMYRAPWKGDAVVKLIVLPFRDADDELMADACADELTEVVGRYQERRKARFEQRSALREASDD